MASIPLLVVVCLAVIVLVFLVKLCRKVKLNRHREQAQTQDIFSRVFNNNRNGPADMDVYNISGRLNGQEQWPTHDGHVSIDSFNIVNEGRKDLTNAPPPYTNVDLPTYDEAIQAMVSQKATTVPVPIHNSSTRGPPPEYLPNV